LELLDCWRHSAVTVACNWPDAWALPHSYACDTGQLSWSAVRLDGT
jgi:hypothetical protein